MQLKGKQIEELQKILNKEVDKEIAERLLSYMELLNNIKDKNYERRKNN